MSVEHAIVAARQTATRVIKASGTIRFVMVRVFYR